MISHVHLQTTGGRTYFQFRYSVAEKSTQTTSGISIASTSPAKLIKDTKKALESRLETGLSMFQAGELDELGLRNFLKSSSEVISSGSEMPKKISRRGFLSLASEWLASYSGDPLNPKHSKASIKEAKTAILYFNEFYVDHSIKAKQFSGMDRENKPAIVGLLNYPLEFITHQLLQNYIDWLSARKKQVGGEPFKKRTIQIHVNKLRTFWRWGQANVTHLSHGFDFPRHYPFHQLKFPRNVVQADAIYQLTKSQNPKSFEPDELSKIFGYIKENNGNCYFDACMVSLLTGASQIDVANMQKSSVDLKNHSLVYFRQKLVRSDGNPRLVKIPMDDYMIEFFTGLLGKYEGEYLIVSAKGKKLLTSTLGHVVNDAVKAMLPDRNLSYGSFRHTFITMSVASGIPPDTVAKMVGNSPEIIFKNYDHSLVKKWQIGQVRSEIFQKLM